MKIDDARSTGKQGAAVWSLGCKFSITHLEVVARKLDKRAGDQRVLDLVVNIDHECVSLLRHPVGMVAITFVNSRGNEKH